MLVGSGGLVLVIDPTTGKITSHSQSDRKSLSAVLTLGPNDYILAGAGEVKRGRRQHRTVVVTAPFSTVLKRRQLL